MDQKENLLDKDLSLVVVLPGGEEMMTTVHGRYSRAPTSVFLICFPLIMMFAVTQLYKRKEESRVHSFGTNGLDSVAHLSNAEAFSVTLKYYIMRLMSS